ncbi:MAG TPA: hypothetical protein PKN99_03270 [Cyclobacteriaceae bacterium]|nr:hypothetical protein [Cyclobacteriaceae bacterium]HRK53898.1 hypothetical protein [Cyclobacteriaceae bacterium]
MKKISTFIILISCSIAVVAQDFDKNIASAKSSYNSGDLENTRFALQQALHELDIVIGKEILKELPTKLGTATYNEKDDNVTGGAGMATGLFVHRSYGEQGGSSIDVINNSPLINSINAILAIPFIGNSGDGTQKVVKIQGYKSVLNKNENETTGKTGYTLQIPLNNTLFTIEMEDTNENEIQSLANTIPLSKIAQIAQ